jgi:hypothetical protein
MTDASGSTSTDEVRAFPSRSWSCGHEPTTYRSWPRLAELDKGVAVIELAVATAAM